MSISDWSSDVCSSDLPRFTACKFAALLLGRILRPAQLVIVSEGILLAARTGSSCLGRRPAWLDVIYRALRKRRIRLWCVDITHRRSATGYEDTTLLLRCTV